MEIKSFECKKCGKCCKDINKNKTVILFPDDIRKLSDYLKVTSDEIKKNYCKIIKNLHKRRKIIYGLKSQANGNCIFLDKDNTCRVHSIKPTQCRLGPIDFMQEYMEDYECVSSLPKEKRYSTFEQDIELFKNLLLKEE